MRLDGSQRPPLFEGEHNLPEQPILALPRRSLGDGVKERDVQGVRQGLLPSLVAESIGSDEKPCVCGGLLPTQCDWLLKTLQGQETGVQCSASMLDGGAIPALVGWLRATLKGVHSVKSYPIKNLPPFVPTLRLGVASPPPKSIPRRGADAMPSDDGQVKPPLKMMEPLRAGFTPPPDAVLASHTAPAKQPLRT